MAPLSPKLINLLYFNTTFSSIKIQNPPSPVPATTLSGLCLGTTDVYMGPPSIYAGSCEAPNDGAILCHQTWAYSDEL